MPRPIANLIEVEPALGLKALCGDDSYWLNCCEKRWRSHILHFRLTRINQPEPVSHGLACQQAHCVFPQNSGLLMFAQTGGF